MKIKKDNRTNLKRKIDWLREEVNINPFHGPTYKSGYLKAKEFYSYINLIIRYIKNYRPEIYKKHEKSIDWKQGGEDNA